MDSDFGKEKPAGAATPDGLQGENKLPNSVPGETRHDSPGNQRLGKQQNSQKSASDQELLARVPTLKKYIERVGATLKSFRRYVIEEDVGKYKREIGSISLTKDGRVYCRDVEKPSDEDLKAIEKEIAGANWPASVGAPKGALPKQLEKVDPKLIFPFNSRDGRQVLFIQQRIEPEDGSDKYYVPWSFWNDLPYGTWRQMEPDGLLPLYGLDKIGDNTTAIIHEGPKAARNCAWMVGRETKSARDAFDAHPWNKELSGAVHLGWAGGAPNAHRTDWSVLRQVGINQIYVSADNDQPGQEAIKDISRLSLLPMTALMYDERFKPGFDLGDPWPTGKGFWKTFEEKEPKYIGPKFHELCIPATWATRKVETGETGRPKYELRKEFIAEWVMSVKPLLFAHRRYAHILLDDDGFNNKIAPFSDVDNVARLLPKSNYAKADGLCYRPFPHGDETPKIINVNGERQVNTYRPPAIKPEKGNVMPFLRYMTHLIPDKGDRKLLMRWIATLVARPEVRMTYSVLLVSKRQGVGKTTLADAILAPLVGPWNVSYPTEQQIVDSPFNTWIERKRLGSINEIYSGDKHKAYNKLKAPVADKRLDVNRKFENEYSIDNYFHAVACSNDLRAIALEDDDRRWLVPAVTETKRSKEFWKRLYAWVNNGGLPFIAWWAEEFVLKHGAIDEADNAPDTSRKQEVIAATRTENKQLVYDLAKAVCEMKEDGELLHGKVILRVDVVRDWVAKRRGVDPGYQKMETPLTLRNTMMEAGMLRPDAKLIGKNKERRIPINGRPVEVLANFQIEAGTAWEDLKKFYKRPSDFIPDEAKEM